MRYFQEDRERERQKEEKECLEDKQLIDKANQMMNIIAKRVSEGKKLEKELAEMREKAVASEEKCLLMLKEKKNLEEKVHESVK